MSFPQKESPPERANVQGGKNQATSEASIHSITFGVKPGTVAVCRTCGYYREVPTKARIRRLCMWLGERLAADAATFDCDGYHAGEWGQLWTE